MRNFSLVALATRPWELWKRGAMKHEQEREQ